MNTQTICFVAGKSGGHIIPCLTLAKNNTIDNTQTNVLFFSANTALDKTILAQNSAVTWHIMLPLSTRAGSLLKTLWNGAYSFIISFFYLLKHRPQKIISTGGIVAIPVCIAGFILRIPIILYSLDAVPGKAIRTLTPLATSVVTCFASAQHLFPARICTVEPYPIKYNISERIIDKQCAREKLGLYPEKSTVLLLGGSQGSLFLNECMKQWTDHPLFATNDIQIIHQTGSTDTTNWKALYTSHNITAHIFSYYPDLSLMYTAADLIICRAGAGTLFEIKFFNKKCIIIPLKTNTTDHQVDNARAMSHEHPELFCTVMQNDVEKKPTILFDTIQQLLHLP